MKRAAPIAVLIAVWLTFLAYGWPGTMTWDSINQLLQVRSGAFGNWHPPFMAWLWSLLDAIVPGPAPMLILQTGLFVVGLYAIFRCYASPLRAAIIAACVFVFPPVFAPMSMIWKDSLMAAVMLCGAAGLAGSTRRARALGWIALGVASMLRHNAPLLVLPLVVVVMPYAPAWSAWRRRALGVGLALALALAGMLVERALTRVDEHPFAHMIAMADLRGIVAEADPMTDDEVRALLAGTSPLEPANLQLRMRELGGPDEGDWESLVPPERPMFVRPTTDAAASAFITTWRRAIVARPGAYLAHRARLFAIAIGLSDVLPTAPFALGAPASQLALVGETPPHARFGRALRWFGRTFHVLFWPVLYLVLGIGLLVILWRDRLQRGLLIGALAYEFGLFFLSPGGHEYRYSHWMITCVVIATVVRFLRRRSARDERRKASPPRPRATDRRPPL